LFSYLRVKNLDALRLDKKGMRDFLMTSMIYNAALDNSLSENYFDDSTVRKNDFSNGLSNCATHRSKNLFSIDPENYVSPAKCLKITTINPPSRLYYSSVDEFIVFDHLPWGFKNNPTWLKVNADDTINISFYYKGTAPVVYINLLEKSGVAKVLMQKDLNDQDNWEKVELKALMPDEAYALQLEITVNKNGPDLTTYLDDIILSRIKK